MVVNAIARLKALKGRRAGRTLERYCGDLDVMRHACGCKGKMRIPLHTERQRKRYQRKAKIMSGDEPGLCI
jgi:hypothetical protein